MNEALHAIAITKAIPYQFEYDSFNERYYMKVNENLLKNSTRRKEVEKYVADNI